MNPLAVVIVALSLANLEAHAGEEEIRFSLDQLKGLNRALVAEPSPSSINNNTPLPAASVAAVAHSNSYNKIFSGPKLVTAVAIAGAESGFDPDIKGDNGTSYGLWQIHVPPNSFDVGLLESSLDYQAYAAVKVYGAQNWEAWTTWWPCSGSKPCILIPHQEGNGSYRKFLTTARSVMQGIDDSAIRNVGDRIMAAGPIFARDVPAGNILSTGGNRSAGETGTIVNGMPDATYLKYLASDDRYYVWWQIQWDSDNVVGWSAEDSLLRIGGGAGTPSISSISPTSVTVSQGGQFTITYTVNGSARSVILGASLFPAGQSTGRIDDPADDQVTNLNNGQTVVSRKFSIPANATPGSYDLVAALWNDVNGNGIIDPTIDQEFPEVKISNAVTVNSVGSGCAYTLSPNVINLSGWGGVMTGFGVFTDATCSWNAIPSAGWIAVTANASGTGTEEVNLSVAPNPTGSNRSATVSVGNHLVTINQPANPYVPPGGNQNVTVLDIYYTPSPVFPGRPITVISDISSPIAQNVLFGATFTVSGTSTTYYDAADDQAMMIFAGTGQRYRTFVLPISAPPVSYDIEVGIWADNNANGIIDPTIDTLLGSFTIQNAVTVQPALGYLNVTISPQSALSPTGNWNIDGGNWLSSGLQNFQAPVGNHTISFIPVPGFATPSNQIVSLQANQTTSAVGTYIIIPVVSSVAYSPSTGFNISWTATPGYTYSVLRSSDVSFPSPTVLVSGIPGSNPTYTDTTVTPGDPAVFYQVRVDSTSSSGATKPKFSNRRAQK